MDRTCHKCNKTFTKPCLLKAHLARKTPCTPITDINELPPSDQAKKHPCKYCGRRFATQISMCRHVRQSCKIANSEDGMEKLVEHTLQRQLTEQNMKIDKLMALMAALAPTVQSIGTAGQVNSGPVTNNTVNQMINIIPWDGDRRICVNVADVVAAFAGNARLKAYSQLGDHELTDPEIAPPYVTELLMDLTKRAHADPTTRNVYLNPRRADQALVLMRDNKWEVLSLQEATRLMFDGVAQGILKISREYAERKQLPLEAQNALAMAGLLYDDEPDEYAKRAKGPMTAHLTNTAPGALPGVQ